MNVYTSPTSHKIASCYICIISQFYATCESFITIFFFLNKKEILNHIIITAQCRIYPKCHSSHKYVDYHLTYQITMNYDLVQQTANIIIKKKNEMTYVLLHLS